MNYDGAGHQLDSGIWWLQEGQFLRELWVYGRAFLAANFQIPSYHTAGIRTLLRQLTPYRYFTWVYRHKK